ncbi:amidase domain-containing protein [Bacillus massiliigorillae]|uniref:amidase domain-containing protein n=1 Tax=Bacillus massiliigorillae TaxID=1243664 RepID=UPI0005AAC06F|nr:amidase domain-containing protein [Bacillus massiliigorillae]
MIKELESYLQNRCLAYVDESTTRDCEKVVLKKALLKKRNAEIKNVKAKGKIQSKQQEKEETIVHYNVHFQYFIKQKDCFYMEEEIEQRVARFKEDTCISDEEVVVSIPKLELSFITYEDDDTRATFYYDRLKAVQYADTWWNGTNPQYQRFNDDCTNFISQCLKAGDAPMRGVTNRSTGWWYSGKNWSYSWTVSHALNLYMQNSSRGLRAKEVDSPDQLLLGDVICYDFEGDGRYNHFTIVTAKDEDGMPLVNAHTTDSRHRYWSYEDSTAYTPEMQYRFFTIVDDE